MNYPAYFNQADVLALKVLHNRRGKVAQAIKPLEIDAIIGFQQAPKLIIIGLAADDASQQTLYQIRNAFYGLYLHDQSWDIMDAGNVWPDHLSNIHIPFSGLLKENTVLVLLSPDIQHGFTLYKAYCELKNTVNYVHCDRVLRLGNHEESLSYDNFISHLISYVPNYLFNISFLAYQTHYTQPEELRLIQRMNFDTLRLGIVRSPLEKTEPILRDADFATLSLACVRRADAPGSIEPTPNGLYGEEFCQIAKYAGLSNQLSSVLMSGFKSGLSSGHTAELMAQTLYYFCEGVHQRIPDGAIGDENQYYVYKVINDRIPSEITFYKHKFNGRWWMRVPPMERDQNRYLRHQLVPCLHEDYLETLRGELPERWWQAFQKLVN